MTYPVSFKINPENGEFFFGCLVWGLSALLILIKSSSPYVSGKDRRAGFSFGICFLSLVLMADLAAGFFLPSAKEIKIFGLAYCLAPLAGFLLWPFVRESDAIRRWLARGAAAGAAFWIAVAGGELFFRCCLAEPLSPPAAAFQNGADKVPGREKNFVILGLADSFGIANSPRNYHDRLREELRDAGHSVDLVNFSVSSISPADELRMLERYGNNVRPDLVLHGFFVGNDFGGDKRKKIFFKRIPIYVPEGLDALRPSGLALAGWLKAYKSIGYLPLIVPENRRTGPAWEKRMHGWLRSAEASHFAALDPRHLGNALEGTWEILDRIREKTEQTGGRYVMVIHPARVQMDEPLRKSLAPESTIPLERLVLDLPQQKLSDYCVSRHVDCLDLLPALLAAGSPGQLYKKNDTHYSEYTDALAGRLIAEFLAEKGYLPPAK